MAKIKRALSIAGSDSGGCAGIQADIKTFSAFGVFGMSVITSVTAQNTLGVEGVYDLPAEFVELQIDAVLSDLGADSVKLGMLSNTGVVEVVAHKLKAYGVENLVVDPVMVSTSGAALSDSDALKALIKYIFPISLIVTPNIPEAEALSAQKVDTVEAMKGAARKIKALGPEYVIIKGGHLDNSPDSIDVLYDGNQFKEFVVQRIDTRNTHGGGCTYSSAVCAGLALGKSVQEAVSDAKDYVTGAISASFDLGSGYGPLNHFWNCK